MAVVVQALLVSDLLQLRCVRYLLPVPGKRHYKAGASDHFDSAPITERQFNYGHQEKDLK